MKIFLTTILLAFSISSFANDNSSKCSLQLNLKSELSVNAMTEMKIKNKLRNKGFSNIEVRRSGYNLATDKEYILDLIINKWGEYSSVFQLSDLTPIEQISGSEIVTNPKHVLLTLIDELSFNCNN